MPDAFTSAPTSAGSVGFPPSCFSAKSGTPSPSESVGRAKSSPSKVPEPPAPPVAVRGLGRLRFCVRFSARVSPSEGRRGGRRAAGTRAAEADERAAGDRAARGQADADRSRSATARRIADAGAVRLPVLVLPARVQLGELQRRVRGLLGQTLRPVLPADQGQGDGAQTEGSGDEAGGDRARETEVSEGSGPRVARRHGVSVVSVRHVWHPLPWGVSASCTRSISPLGTN